MRVIIREREYEYLSDFPNGWKFGEGDYLKFPVEIGSNKCFIRRFEKSPESISGWQLLHNLKGKNFAGLAGIYDIAETNEHGKNIFYVFQEFIEGETLDRLITRKAAVNLENLTNDLFDALQSLNQNNYWFADFCEKNIFCNNSGRFLLIDLDGAQPVSKTPDNKMRGSKDYWSTVFDFYTNVLRHTQVQPSDFNGNSFNYLQVIFLILRLKIFYSVREIEYDSGDFLYHLPFYLSNTSPLYKRVFNKVVKNGQLPLDLRDINEIKYLIKTEIISVTNPNIIIGKKIPPLPNPVINEITESNYSKEKDNEEKSEELNKDDEVYEAPIPEIPHIPIPVISEFTVSNYVERNGNEYIIESGRAFKLKWNVQNVTNVELYKNGELYTKQITNEENIDLTEKTNDAKSKTIEYKLIASNNNESVTKSLVIRLVYRNPVINEFTVADYFNKEGNDFLVETGKPFKLRWQVQNAVKIELFKNGKPFQKFDNDEENITLEAEIQDDQSKMIEYTLTASNDSESVTKSLVIRLIYRNPVINEFTVADYFNKENNDFLVETGKPFKLKWQVQNAVNIELFKNGKPVQKFDNDEKNITLKEEIQEAQSKRIEYTLTASSDNESVTKSLAIRFVYPDPVINEFTVVDYFNKENNDFIVETGKPFKLRWDVQNALNIVLFKNEKPYQKFDKDEKNIAITIKEDVQDGKPEIIKYTLAVSNDNESISSKSLTIRFVHLVPAINDFTISHYFEREGKEFVVENKKSFILQWNVQNAANIELYKDGNLYKKLNSTEKNIQLTEEIHDGKSKRIEYTLVASKENESPAQKSLIIKVIYPEPVINQFKANKHVVSEGKAFKLIWNVKNVSVLKLLRNGQLYETISPAEESKELTEKAYDGKKEIEYSLLVSNGFVEKRSEPVIITLKPASPPVVKKLIPALLGVLLLALILFFFLRPHPAEVYPFTQQQIAENNTITISGKHLPTNKGSVQVNFNNTAGVITQQTAESLNVRVPKLSSENAYVTIHVNIDGKPFTAADHVLYTAGSLPAPALTPVSLPSTFSEIWHNEANNEFVNIDLSKNVIYYSDNRNSYGTYKIIKIDSSQGTYKITGKAQNESKLFLIRYISPRALALSVDENLQQNDRNRFQKMFLYYENDPSAIYLPVINSAERDLDESQKNKLKTIIKNAGDTATVFLSNKYTPPPANNDINRYLGTTKKEYTIVTQDAFDDNPFRRNYFTFSSSNNTNTTKDNVAKTTEDNVVKTTEDNVAKSDNSKTTSEPPKTSGQEIDMGYLKFDNDNELDNAGVQLVKQIAQELKTNPSLKIKFYVNWNNEDEEEIVNKNISALKNFYLKDEGISLLSNQLASYATNLKHPNEDVNKIYIRATDFSGKAKQ